MELIRMCNKIVRRNIARLFAKFANGTTPLSFVVTCAQVCNLKLGSGRD